jgi:predicted TIM-barrel fold metal-dependent hydrolase
MKVDFHVHVTPPDIIADWEKYAQREPYFSLLSRSKQNKFATAEDAAAMLVGAELGRAVVFGFAFRDLGLCRYVNDYVIEKTKEYPEKLIGFMVVPPQGEKAAKEIERCYSAGLKGVGELYPEGQGIDLENKNETAAITGACRELALPLLLHANEPVGHLYPGKSNVCLTQIAAFVSNNPGLDIVLAHWGGGLFFYETMKEIREKFSNVYYDTAASVFLYDSRIYRAAKALGLYKKILFGSDYPLLSPLRYYKDIEECGFSREEKEFIMGGNARRLLGI